MLNRVLGFCKNWGVVFAVILLFATLIVCLEANKGFDRFSLADEGYLWYGAQRVLHGELPIRDFQSYDIGRYFWCASLMKVLNNDGIVIERIAQYCAAPVGLACALVMLRKSGLSWGRFWYCLLGIIIIFAITSVRTHILDCTLSLLMVAGCSYLIRLPNPGLFFLNGLILGLAAVVGRNHALYGLIGYSIALAFLIKRDNAWPKANRISAAAFGLTAGYLPVILVMIFAPGFAQSFWETTHGIVKAPLNWFVPVPMPWDAWTVDSSLFLQIHQFLLGYAFIGLAAFDVVALVYVIRDCWGYRQVQHPVLAASVFFSLPYTHYAYARADAIHFICGCLPLLIGLFTIITSLKVRYRRVILLGVLSLAVFLFCLPMHQIGRQLIVADWTDLDLNGDRLLVEQPDALRMEELLSLVSKYAHGGSVVLAEPDMDGLYAILRQRAPVWEIYPLYKRTEGFQLAEIRRIESANPRLVLVHEYPVDSMDERRFSQSHWLIAKFIGSRYRRLPSPENQPHLLVFVR